MKLLYEMITELKQLSIMSVLTLKAAYILTNIMLLCALLISAFPGLAGSYVDATIYSHELCSGAARLLTLGVIASFSIDIINRQ